MGDQRKRCCQVLRSYRVFHRKGVVVKTQHSDPIQVTHKVERVVVRLPKHALTGLVRQINIQRTAEIQEGNTRIDSGAAKSATLDVVDAKTTQTEGLLQE